MKVKALVAERLQVKGDQSKNMQEHIIVSVLSTPATAAAAAAAAAATATTELTTVAAAAR